MPLYQYNCSNRECENYKGVEVLVKLGQEPRFCTSCGNRDFKRKYDGQTFGANTSGSSKHSEDKVTVLGKYMHPSPEGIHVHPFKITMPKGLLKKLTE